MATRYNAATRIHKLLQGLPTRGGSALEIWCMAFYLTPEGRYVRFTVADRLHEISEELRLIENTLPPYALDMASPGLGLLAEFFSPSKIEMNWTDVYRDLGDKAFTHLEYWSALLPEEETELEAQDLYELEETIERMLLHVGDSTLPETLRELLGRQVRHMRRALSTYSIRGVAALRSGEAAVAGEYIGASPEDRKAAVDAGVVDTLQDYFSTADKLVNHASTFQKGYELITKVSEWFQSLT